MSLFKIRDFWSFDLHQLHEHYGASDEADASGSGEASFIASLGRFHSVGEQDVFVCAHLDGFICLLQLPESKQIQNITTEADRRPKIDVQHGDRQLLLASKLDYPIVDLKCGFFASTLKQSIAVLSFDKLVVYQVKRHQVDLISASIDGKTSPAVDSSLLSHQLVEYHRVDLAYFGAARFQGFPANLVILRNHLEDQATAVSHGKHKTKSSHHHRHLATLQLPQRDALLILYTNQLAFTIVDHKKIVGHYSLSLGQDQSSKLNANLSQNTGSMPACYVHNSSGPMLVVSTSDHKLHCLPFAKLVSQSKQNVMRRVAQSLLFDGKKSSMIHDNLASKEAVIKDDGKPIQVDLKLNAEWQLELPNAPLELHPINKGPSGGQFLVVSRHNLDLYSSSGQHLWCHRSETPIICVHTYHLKAIQTGQPAASECKLMSLVCSSSLSTDRCNLSVMEEDRIVWSAMLNTWPIQLWCASFNRMLGVLATMGAMDGCLSLSYLGTNRPDMEQEFQSEQGIPDELLQLLSLDDNFAFKELEPFERKSECDVNDEVSSSKERSLAMDVKLEAKNQWPSVQVESRIKVRALSGASGVLQNIVAILEFDDLLAFEPTESMSISMISEGVIQVQLGSCWPDCREPISFEGTFSCRNFDPTDNLMLLPKSLMVRIYFKFNQSRRGSCIQQESFMLPLNMVTKLAHIDYSSGQNEQSLADVQANLSPVYKRQILASFGGESEDQDVSKPAKLPYYLCDLFIKTHCDIIDLVDELVENDLVCRGLNTDLRQRKQEVRSKEDNLRTLENISLLAQSLDCRLRYKSLASHQTRLTRQSSEEYSPVIMVSIALKIPNVKSTIAGLVDYNDDDASGDCTIVWIHLSDLTAEGSVLPEEIIKQHMSEWKTYEQDLVMRQHPDQQVDLRKHHHPLLITIECDYPVPVLFIQSHLVDRLNERSTLLSDLALDFYPMTESTFDKFDINLSEAVVSLPNIYSISNNLHDCLRGAIGNHKLNVASRLKQLKLDLDREYFKFNTATMASLSLAKRLANLPEGMRQQFNQLCTLTKNYYMNLNRLLSELERLKKLQHHFSKLPGSYEILIESNEEGQTVVECWSDLSQIP